MFSELDEKLYLPIAFVVGFTALAMSLIRLDLLWSSISLIYILLMVGLSRSSQNIKKRWDLIKFISLPLIIGSSGINIFVDNFILFLSIIPVIAFIIILNLLNHTSFRADFDFESLLIISFTISTGALLTIGQFFSDRYLDTNFLMDNNYMMGELFFFTLFAIIGGILFKNYLMKIEYDEIERFKFRIENEQRKRKMQFLEVLGHSYNKDERDRKLLASKALQIGILIIGIYGVYSFDVRVILLSTAALGVTALPYIYSYNMEDKVPSFFTLLISISLFFYILGSVTGFYSYFNLPYFWWNRFIHFIGGTVISFMIYIYLYYKNQTMKELYVPLWMIPLIVLTFLMTISIAFELFEFIIDILFRSSLQDSLTDTIYDLISNIMGASLSILITHVYYRSYFLGDTTNKKESEISISLNRSK